MKTLLVVAVLGYFALTASPSIAAPTAQNAAAGECPKGKITCEERCKRRGYSARDFGACINGNGTLAGCNVLKDGAKTCVPE